MKLFLIELKENLYYYYLKLIILYPGFLIVLFIISLNLVHALTYGDMMTNNESRIYPDYLESLQKHVDVSVGLTDLDAALSIASFEPNPEYLYLYRLERKIELINLLIQKIIEKNPTHLHLDWTKTNINAVPSNTFITQSLSMKALLYARLYDPNFYNLEIKATQLDHEESNKILQIMVGEDTVVSKFDQALQIITFADAEILRKTSSPIYDCTLLFGEKQGLINFSNGYQNFAYMDLCALECLVAQIVHLLISHYWILPENIDLEGQCYLKFCWPKNYFISINGEEISTSWYSWKRSYNQVGLIKSMSEILVGTIDKEDNYSQIMLGMLYDISIEPYLIAKRSGQEIGFISDAVYEEEFEDYLHYLETSSIVVQVSIIRWLYYGK
ncbi:MAG TPA: hypothetical protein VN854_00490 [Mycoplasmatales bacterium]|nr:hypothetical protein [Mycoplasmatales bacterium]